MATIVTYNGYTLPFVYDKFSYSEDEVSISLVCTFLITSTTSGGLVSACQTAEEKLTEKNKDFSLCFEGSNELDFSHDANTGFLARTTLRKIGGDLDLALSRAYGFTIRMQLPFAQTGYNYRRNGSFSISYSPSRQRQINFLCLYTAGGANSALVNYHAGVNLWVTSVLNALGGTYEKTFERLQEEHQEKILNASLTYQEILAKQSSAAINHTSIVDPICDISVQHDQTTGLSVSDWSYKVYPKTTIKITYSCKIDAEVVPAPDDIENVYQDVVKPYFISRAYALLGLSNYATFTSNNYIPLSETKTLNPYNYTVSGVLVLLAPKNLNQIMELTETIATHINKGVVARKIWDGSPDTHAVYSIGRHKTLSRRLIITQLGKVPRRPTPYHSADPGKWLLQDVNERVSQKVLGAATKGASLNTKIAYSKTFNETYLYVVPVFLSSKKTELENYED